MTDWLGTGISPLPITAVAGVVAGVALGLIAFGVRTPGAVLGVFTGVIGVMALIEHIAGADLGINSFLMTDHWDAPPAGRMGPLPAFGFALVGVAIALRSWGGRRGARLAGVCGLVVGAIAMLSIVGYLYGAAQLFAVPHVTVIAVPTSLSLLALWGGITGLVWGSKIREAISGTAASDVLIRRLAPLILIVPITIGWFRVMGERSLLMESAFATALQSIVEVALLAGLLWWTMRAARAHERALKESQARLQQQSAQLAAVFNQSGIFAWILGLDGVLREVNDLAVESCGYTREEVLSKPYWEAAWWRGSPEAQGRIREAVARARAGEVFHEEVRYWVADGSERVVEFSVHPVRDASGAVILLHATGIDITERHRVSRALRDSERRFHEMIDSLPALIYTTDAQERVTYCNPAAVALVGDALALGARPWGGSWKLFSPDGEPMADGDTPMARALKGERIERGVEIVAEELGARRVWLQVFPTPVRNASGRIVGAINLLVDVTERKQAERTSARLAAIVASSDDAIISKTTEGTITSWNRGAEKIFGYTEAEAVGRNIKLIVPPERHAEEEDVLARLRRGKSIDHFETIRRAKDGRLLDISLSVSPLRDSAGRVIGASKVARDITDRKRAEAALAAHAEELERRVEERTRELTEAHERLRLADRMAAVGTLAAGLAHDMKNVLLPLGMRLDGMLAAPDLPRDIAEDLGVIGGLLDHLRAMARNLSLFAQDPNQEGTEGRTSLAPWSAQVRGFIDASAGASIYIEWDIPEGLADVAIAPHRLTQAVLNLVHNGRDAILAKRGDGGRDRKMGRIVVQARPGRAGRVLLSVRDDGCGMDEETRKRCLEPFYTTKDRPQAPGAGGGTGLGLSIAHAIVERVGGTIDIESARGKGTVIILNLPAAQAETNAVMVASPARGKARVNIRDARRRAVVRQLLRDFRYEITEGPVQGVIPPDESLWVTDGHEIAPGQAGVFLAEGGNRRVVLLCPGDNGPDAWPSGVERVHEDTSVTHLRAMLGSARRDAALAPMGVSDPVIKIRRPSQPSESTPGE